MVRKNEDLIPVWARKYIGKEYPDPYGCFLMIAEVLRNEFGFEKIPDFSEGIENDTFRSRAARISEALDKNTIKVSIEEIRPGDIVVIQGGGYPVHVGILISKKHMMHVVKDINTCIEPIDRFIRLNRVEGFYRPCKMK